MSSPRAMAITYQPYHDNSKVRAFYGTLDAAKAEAIRIWGDGLGEDTLEIFDESGLCLAEYSDYELVGDRYEHTGRHTWRGL